MKVRRRHAPTLPPEERRHWSVRLVMFIVQLIYILLLLPFVLTTFALLLAALRSSFCIPLSTHSSTLPNLQNQKHTSFHTPSSCPSSPCVTQFP
jgi:hypothetical protein